MIPLAVISSDVVGQHHVAVRGDVAKPERNRIEHVELGNFTVASGASPSDRRFCADVVVHDVLVHECLDRGEVLAVDGGAELSGLHRLLTSGRLPHRGTYNVYV